MISAWDEGFHARMRGEDPAIACPYKHWTEKWFEWVDGWKDADAHQSAKATCLPDW